MTDTGLSAAAAEFWDSYTAPVGVGRSPDQALADLARKVGVGRG